MDVFTYDKKDAFICKPTKNYVDHANAPLSLSLSPSHGDIWHKKHPDSMDISQPEPTNNIAIKEYSEPTDDLSSYKKHTKNPRYALQRPLAYKGTYMLEPIWDPLKCL